MAAPRDDLHTQLRIHQAPLQAPTEQIDEPHPAPVGDDWGPIVKPLHSQRGDYLLVEPFRPPLPPPLDRELGLVIRANGPGEQPFFNGASVPRVAWFILRPMDPRVVAAALVHDQLYVHAGRIDRRPASEHDPQGGPAVRVSRLFADLCFFYLMVQARLPLSIAWPGFLTVATVSFPWWGRRRPPGPVPDTEPAPADWQRVMAHEALHLIRAQPGSFARVHVILGGLALVSFLLLGRLGPPQAWWDWLRGPYAAVFLFVGGLSTALFLGSIGWWAWLARCGVGAPAREPTG